MARPLWQVGRTLQLGICLLLPLACREAAADNVPSVTDLARALRGLRLVEPRFSGGFDHEPCIPADPDERLLLLVQCSPFPEEGSWAATALDRLRTRLRAEIEDGHDSRAVHAEAVLSALFGATRPAGEARASLLKRAIASLTQLSEQQPRNSHFVNDLAATYYLQAIAADDPADLVVGLNLIEKAYALDPLRPEIRFNRALLRSRLHLVLTAKEAWQAVATLENGSDWAAEAREFLEPLSQPGLSQQWEEALPALEQAALAGDRRQVRRIVEIDRQRAREYAIADRLGGWGDKHLTGDPRGAARDLAVAQAIGVALAEAGGDSSTDRAVSAILGVVTGSGPASAVSRLAGGHSHFRKAIEAYRKLQPNVYEREFEAAAQDFADSESPMHRWALAGIAVARVYASRYGSASRLFRQAQPKPGTEASPSLKGWVLRGQGWSELRSAHYSSALSSLLAAQNEFHTARERENDAAAVSLAGEALASLGQLRASLRLSYEALSLLSTNPESVRRHNTLRAAGDALLRENLPFAAVAFDSENVSASSMGSDSRFLSEALLQRARALAACGRGRLALADIRAARAVARTGDPDSGPSRKLLADLAMAEAEVRLAQGLPPEAASLKGAREYYERFHPFDVIDGYLIESKGLDLAGRRAEAGKVLESVARLAASRSGRLSAPSLSISHAMTFQASFDRLSERALQDGDGDRALDYLERARSLFSLSAGERSMQRPWHSLLGGIQAHLGPREGVLLFGELPSTLAVWLLTRDGLSFVSADQTRRSMSTRSRAFRECIRNEAAGEACQQAGSELAEILLPPNLLQGRRLDGLYIVPDGSLNTIPFAFLRDPLTGRRLVDSMDVSIFRSLGQMLVRFETRPRQPASLPVPLIVGDPEPAQSPGRRASLPFARYEATRAAKRSGAGTLLLGPEATRERVARELPGRDVFVFAGHSQPGEEVFSDSALVLAASSQVPTRATFLFASEIAKLDLQALRLVVLSSCTSAGAVDSRTVSPLGLASAFLSAGADAVLATLWDTRDAALKETSSLFLDAEGIEDPAGRLAALQRRTVRDPKGRGEGPFPFAGIQCYGCRLRQRLEAVQ